MKTYCRQTGEVSPADLQFRKTRPENSRIFVFSTQTGSSSSHETPSFPPAPKTDSFGYTCTSPSAPPRNPHHLVSSLAVERRYDRGLLGAAGLRDRRPHGSLLHVVVVVVVMHVVAGGRRWGQPGRLVAGRRGGPERAETWCGWGGRGGAGHGHLGGAAASAGATIRCSQFGEHGDGVGEVRWCSRSVSGSTHLFEGEMRRDISRK